MLDYDSIPLKDLFAKCEHLFGQDKRISEQLHWIRSITDSSVFNKIWQMAVEHLVILNQARKISWRVRR